MAEFVVRSYRSPRLMIGNRIEQSDLLYGAASEGEISTWGVRCRTKHVRWVRVHMQDMGIVVVREQKAG